MQTILDALPIGAAQDREVFCHFIHAGRETAISRGDLRRGAERYANLFHRSGVAPGEVVLIILRHSPDLLYSFLGALLTGAIPSFLPYPTSKQDPRLYWSSHQKLFERIGAGALLTYRENLSALRENTTHLPLHLLTSEEAENFPTGFAPHAASPGETALLQHSSGTTGLKKGVALSHQAVLRQVASYAQVLKITPGDCIVSWLPLYHDMGLIACFLLPLITNIPVVMVDPFEWVVNPQMLFDAVQAHRGTLCWLPNFAFHHLCRTVRPSPNLDLSSVRAWIDCSEPCRAETFELFARTFARAGVKPENLQVCYAMAETVFAVTQTPPGRPPRVLTVDPEMLRLQGRVQEVPPDTPHQSALSTGPAIPGLRVRIANDQGEPLPDDSVGEIHIAGDCLFSGYFKLEEETRRKLQGGWYRSGDLGFLHQGELYVTGRKNDLIIVHGRNYYAHELEYLVNQVPGTYPGRNVATGWFRPEIGSEEVIIIAEIKPESDVDRAQLAQDIKQRLLDQTGLLVFDVHLVNPGWLVKTTSGKISRGENLNKYQAALGACPAC
jgi:fatty-acyl-CoA synthase